DGQPFDGNCWFGDLSEAGTGAIAASGWEDDPFPTAAQLHLNRQNEPGTSALVVGFNLPAEETALHPTELCHRLCSAAVQHFWPVISAKPSALEVAASFTDVETGEVRATSRAEINDDIRPFVSCLDAFRGGRVREGLANPDDVAAEAISLKIPAPLS